MLGNGGVEERGMAEEILIAADHAGFELKQKLEAELR